jgi:hypothetical protein
VLIALGAAVGALVVLLAPPREPPQMVSTTSTDDQAQPPTVTVATTAAAPEATPTAEAVAPTATVPAQPTSPPPTTAPAAPTAIPTTPPRVPTAAPTAPPTVVVAPTATFPPTPVADEPDRGQASEFVAQPVEPVREPRLEPSPTPDPVTALIDQLDSGDGATEQRAAKILYRTYRAHPRAQEAAKSALLAGYNVDLDDERHVDAMAWLCNLLGASENPQYAATLNTVMRQTKSRKIKKFAEKNLKRLR